MKKQRKAQSSQQQQNDTYHTTLQYYKQKVDDLYNERLAWLSKFDECNSKLTEKHELNDKLKNIKNQQRQLNKSLIHHNVAILDEKLNVLKMQRQNMMRDYEDAAEVIKIQEVMEEYPDQIERQFPCLQINQQGLQNGEFIYNQLNIHNSKKGSKSALGRQSTNKRKQGPSNFNIHHALQNENGDRYGNQDEYEYQNAKRNYGSGGSGTGSGSGSGYGTGKGFGSGSGSRSGYGNKSGSGKHTKGNRGASGSRSAKNFKKGDRGIHHNHLNSSATNANKISPQQLLQQQITELKHNQEQQLAVMRQQADKIESMIKQMKSREGKNVGNDREIVAKLNKDYKALQKKHKALADQYFQGRRQQKQDNQKVKAEKQQLEKKNKNLEEMCNKQIKIYEKQNKAKQTLILKRSEDFQQDYKARMRAKEYNLQSLKQNYEKMQEVCIKKVKKLERAVEKAKKRLSQGQDRREFLVEELRGQLRILQKRVQQQKYQKAQRDMRLKQRIQREKQINQLARQRQQKAQIKLERHRMVDDAYKKTLKRSNSKARSKSKPKRQQYHENQNYNKAAQKAINKPKRDIYGNDDEEQEDDEDQSLQMSDLENIRKQIGELESQIGKGSK